MSDTPKRLDRVRNLAAIGRLFGILGMGGLLILASIRAFKAEDALPSWVDRVDSIMVLVCAAILAASLLVFVWAILQTMLKIEADAFRQYDVSRDMVDLLKNQENEIRMMAESAQLSDVVRSVTHRGRERTALRLAINEEIIRGDWEAAYALVELLESRHGYRNEAARLRAEVDQSRQEDIDSRLNDSISQVRELMAKHDWDSARRMMDRLMASNGQNAEVQALPDEFKRTWNDHKRRLLKEWDQCIQRNDVDRSITILKDLDHYLTPSEAAALEESARGVFRAKLQNLGVQFSLAVTEHNWSQAVDIGKQIQDEFPNSRMASEVRSRFHVLEKRVGQA